MIDMIYQNYKSYMINIQNNILQYLDWENDTEEKFQKINSLFRSNDFEKNTYELKSILYFISNISRNHHREQYFFEKIDYNQME